MIQRLHFARAFAPFAVLMLGLGMAGSAALAQDNQPAPPPTPMYQRINDLENAVQRLTGEIEELQHQNQVLQTKVDRLQRALDYQQSGGSATSPSDGQMGGDNSGSNSGGDEQFDEGNASGPSRPAPAHSSAGEGLAPGPANLGSIPANTPMPLPKPGGTTTATTTTPATSGRQVASLSPSAGSAQGDYDAAMTLLRKAQYDAAQQAFRAFADAHPADPHAADALFWSGDIAYSARHDYANAARTFLELVKKYGKSGRAAEAMLKLGLSLLALGQKQEGCATLAALPTKYASATALTARAAAERKRAACT